MVGGRDKPWSFKTANAGVPTPSSDKLQATKVFSDPKRIAASKPGAPAGGRSTRGGRSTSDKDGRSSQQGGRASQKAPGAAGGRSTRGGRPATRGKEEANRRTGSSALGENSILELLESFDRVPSLAVTPSRLKDLSLDHKTGFLISQVDGQLTIDMLVDVSGMRRLEALRAILKLVDQEILKLD